MRAKRVFFIGLVLCLLAPTAASAGGPGKWTRVTGPDSWFELNLVRHGTDLHISVREDESESSYRLIHRAISAAGDVGPLNTLAQGFSYLGYYPGMVTAENGSLRVLFGSLEEGDALPNSSMRYVESTDGGETWTAPTQTGVTGGNAQSPSQMDATMDRLRGVPYEVWEGTLCICVQRGMGPQETHTNFNDVGGNNMDPSIAYDHESTKVWVSWVIFGADLDGIYVREVDTMTGEPAGPSTLVPGSFDTYEGDRLINFQNGRVPMVEGKALWGGRGVFIGYRKGYPTATRMNVWRIGDAAATTVAKTGKGIGEVALAADGKLRVWALWVSDGRIFARRSNPGSTVWGKTVSTKIPSDSVGITTLQADAQNGKVDVLAHASKVEGSGFFHTQLRPGISFSASPVKFSGRTRVMFITKDAGVPLKGTRVTIDGKSCTTEADGQCSINLGPYSGGKKLRATAKRSGYVSASVVVRAQG